MSKSYEKRPVIGMIALIWVGLIFGAGAYLGTGLLQVGSIIGFAALLAFYHAIESRGGMVATARAAHPAYRYAVMVSAAVPVAGMLLLASGGSAHVFVGGLVGFALALTAWHFAPGQRLRSTALEVQ